MEMDNRTIVENVSRILSEPKNHVKWEKAYVRYADKIEGNSERYDKARKLFRLPKPMYAYSSISLASSTLKYDIRAHGQSIGSIQVKDGIPYLDVPVKKAKKTEEYFRLPCSSIEQKNWSSSKEAAKFRAVFRNWEYRKLKSEEHSIENLLLAEFAKGLRSDNKMLCNIQPVQLSKCFFQLTTPLKASTHAPSFSMNDKGGATGGGIDMLARIKHLPTETRLAIIELKDDNNKKEPQKEVMLQALSYATFIAFLLRSKSADKWWKLLGFSGQMPEFLELDVITLMPKGFSEEGEKDAISIEPLNVTLNPMTLYYELDSGHNLQGFSGTLLESIYQAGK